MCLRALTTRPGTGTLHSTPVPTAQPVGLGAAGLDLPSAAEEVSVGYAYNSDSTSL